MAMVQDTQGKRWKRPQVSRILARPTRVLWQEALLTDVCWRDVCPRWRRTYYVFVKYQHKPGGQTRYQHLHHRISEYPSPLEQTNKQTALVTAVSEQQQRIR